MPTKWFAAIGTGLFLAVTAAFGGLATVQAAEPTTLEPGATHTNAQLAVTPTRAAVVDEFGGSTPGRGERFIVVYLDAENQWTKPLATTTIASVFQTITLPTVTDAAPRLTIRTDDDTPSPVLQPGVAAPLAIAWRVPIAELPTGELKIAINDTTLARGSMVISGEYWTDPVVAATMTLPLDDLGDGETP